MFTMILIMTFGIREGVTSQQITGYPSLEACNKAIKAIYSPKYESYNAICVPAPSDGQEHPK